jgi:hypothetical protein
MPAPTIGSLTPNFGPSGTNVKIIGSNLGSAIVTFNGHHAAILSQTAGSIVCIAPASTTGPVIAISDGQSSNSLTFTYTTTGTPSITSLTPNSGPAGTTVVIAGNSFGTAQGSSTVSFNGVPATVVSWSNTSISAVVPGTATTGNVKVTVGLAVSNGVLFTVTTPSNGGTLSPLNLFLIPAQDFLDSVMWTLDPTNFDDPGLGGFYFWKTEDVIAGRIPKVSRVIISYRDIGVATFTITITGTNEEGKVVSNTTSTTVGTTSQSGKIATKIVGLLLRAQNLQVSISRNPGSGPLSITKVRLEGAVETTAYA